jgi:2-oxo-4-hydroxy-4-carboxy-5-ureidoimidazoline decarboxylase
MTLTELNNLDPAERRTALEKCNGSRSWIEMMTRVFPVADTGALLAAADHAWQACGPADWREAFTHHPRIGDIGSLRKKFANTAQWAAGEQAGVGSASEDLLEALAAGNRAYEEKFGYIFIVCATGRSAAEMLDLLRQRLGNDPEKEIQIAMAEQGRITRLRLEKLLT